MSPRPVNRRLWTSGVKALALLVVIGLCIAAYRFIFGLSSVTNLDQQHPWGLWIAIDVATGVALAAGGFTSAALIYIFHKKHFHLLARPALLTAMLGYTFVAIALLVDLGRYYNIWHPLLPSMWQGNSVLFEVALCVTCYLTVLYIEFLPAVCERLIGSTRYPRLGRLCTWTQRFIHRTLFLFIIAGVVLSCLHQSSLGNLMVIAPTKVHPLWYTPILSLLFLLSAVAVGFPMIIIESLYASWSLQLEPEMHLLSQLSKYAVTLVGAYLAFKIGDMVLRESYVTLMDGSIQSLMFAVEMIMGLIVPFLMLLSNRVRNSRRGLCLSSLFIVLGVALNRVNVFLIAYQPPYATQTYFPSISEIVVTLAMISLLIIVYRIIVTYLPVIGQTIKPSLP